MITVSSARSDDFKSIQEIAHATWPVAYGGILEKAQLDYMLALFYSEEALSRNVAENKQQFLIAKEDDNAVGFASYENDYNQTAATKIHKLYVLPNTQGKGIGQLLIAAVTGLAKYNNSRSLFLNVNRSNKAIGFYVKFGFEIVGQEDIQLDHGYLMEDYIMEKKLKPYL